MGAIHPARERGPEYYEDTMSNQTLTYRGVKYERVDPMTTWMLNRRLKEQREDFEKKLDRERMKGQVV